MSRASNRTEERRTKSTERISFLSGCEQILLPSNRASSSFRGGIPDFPPVSEKGDDGSACDSGISQRLNLRGRRIAPVRQNCRNDDGFLHGTRSNLFKNLNLIKTRIRYYLDIGRSERVNF